MELNQKENELLSFSEKNRELRKEFDGLIEELKQDLWNYCRYITGSPWDGEDLFQETMVKAFGGLYQRWHPTNPKSYLYRVATTTWIDYCRKQKRVVGTLEEGDMPTEEFIDRLEVEEALTHLAVLFTPRESAVFLLKEVFSFSAKEVAGIVHTTPGAVYASVRRMKEKLKETSIKEERSTNVKASPQNDHVIKAYLKALSDGDVEAVLSLLSDDAQNDVGLGFQEYSKSEMRSGSMQFGLPGFRAEPFFLWEKPVIVVFNDDEEGAKIHDIQYQEVENDKIVYHRSFYFRKELIVAAAQELGFLPQVNKPATDW
ncbi:RNA polymerase sigma factor [Guptibacillus algicola]|uniref:RNA polymerase sigma factor n=1 Tax=Guptibacillus algicola TaxID=225844 RepID=UPI001CD4FF46|nr:RNA polymerase sigma factor [Alkalihalobacillus algicola]MCA0987499.1 RNA polymerase sigma factor [Alkalihalobacillus algicola]